MTLMSSMMASYIGIADASSTALAPASAPTVPVSMVPTMLPCVGTDDVLLIGDTRGGDTPGTDAGMQAPSATAPALARAPMPTPSVVSAASATSAASVALGWALLVSATASTLSVAMASTAGTP